MFDFFVNMNTGYYQKGELILDRKQIITNYLKNNIVFDILSTLYLFDVILMINITGIFYFKQTIQ